MIRLETPAEVPQPPPDVVQIPPAPAPAPDVPPEIIEPPSPDIDVPAPPPVREPIVPGEVYRTLPWHLQ